MCNLDYTSNFFITSIHKSQNSDYLIVLNLHYFKNTQETKNSIKILYMHWCLKCFFLCTLHLQPHLVELLPCDIHILISLPPLHLRVFPAAAAVTGDGLFHILPSGL